MAGWRTHGVSVEGYRHRRTGAPCQDAWDSAVWGADGGPEVTVLAVADGAGSRPRSQEGARLAVRLAVEHFGRTAAAAPCPAGEAAHQLLLRTYELVRDDFASQVAGAARLDDFATTLTVVVLTPDWLGHVSVGDGFVIVRAGADAEGKRQYHLLPQAEAASEYSNETVFLTSPRADRWVRTDCVRDPGVDGVLLSTDGLVQAALTSAGTPNSAFVAAVLGSLERPDLDPDEDGEQLAELLRSDRLSALNADDKTVLRAVRR
ncbi:PP2C family serine/threonine-protein phosphatase [Streptomyces sp. NBC_01304]|uniref:PP2C family serine/threonine-protein phosphatase n=1 Tax=Streptomyces sp. NBC_01304 TaxID=2903818 RepID=UPI002E0E5348|nr:protein phosphatase 2C domain-containing protein [Streptomyces sp. NBC_01304]